MAFANSEGVRIFYRLEGHASKPLLVLVHALGTDHGLWSPQMTALLGQFQVLRLDLRGHGASDAPAGDYAIAQLAGDVLACVDAAGHREFAYCGLSIGGIIGLWLAANAGARLTKMVLANTTAKFPDPSLFEARRTTVLEGGTAAVIDAVMDRFFTGWKQASANPMVASIRNTVLATDRSGYAGCCAAIRDMDQTDLPPRVRVPTLVIGGERDVSTPWAGNGELLVERISGARGVLLDAAHLSNVERPSAFAAAVLDFLTPASSDTLAAGSAMRRSVLGDAHVDRAIAHTTDFTREFQELITRYAWGTVWTRPGLEPRMRRLLTLAITASLGRWEEFRLHTRTGLANELELADLKEVLLQVAIYAGVPAANTGFQIAAELSTERGS